MQVLFYQTLIMYMFKSIYGHYLTVIVVKIKCMGSYYDSDIRLHKV